MKYYNIVYNDGKWENIMESNISITNLGFQFGYGVFETIRFADSDVVAFDRHLRRMQASLKAYSIDYLLDSKELYDIVLNGIAQNQAKAGTIKIIITPNEHSNKSDLYILYRKIEEIKKIPVHITLLNENDYHINRTNSFHKSLNYIGNYIASKYAREKGYFEPIFFNKDGYITEGAFRNIFFVKKKKLVTPPLSMGILPGTTRESVILISKELNIPLDESKIHIDMLDDMDEAFITSAGIGIVPCIWDGWIGKSTITQIIKNKFNSI